MEKDKYSVVRKLVGNKWLKLALVAVILIVGIIYLCLCLTRGTELPETAAWARVGQFQASNDVDSIEKALDDYLWTYSDGRYAEDARTLRNRLRSEREEWEKVMNSDFTLERVDEYIYAHPDGFFHYQALMALDSLTFLKACEDNTESAIMGYLDQYPDGRFVERARQQLKNVGKQEVSQAEKTAAADMISKHFAAMQDNSQTIVTTIADNLSSYIGKPTPTVEDVLAYMAHFHKGSDTKLLEASNYEVEKMMSIDGPMYSVQFKLKETINAEDTAKVEVKHLTGIATLDVNMLITSLVLKRDLTPATSEEEDVSQQELKHSNK